MVYLTAATVQGSHRASLFTRLAESCSLWSALWTRRNAPVLCSRVFRWVCGPSGSRVCRCDCGTSVFPKATHSYLLHQTLLEMISFYCNEVRSVSGRSSGFRSNRFIERGRLQRLVSIWRFLLNATQHRHARTHHHMICSLHLCTFSQQMC